jgi:hypothetical protein
VATIPALQTPTLELPKLERPKFQVPEAISRMELPAFDPPNFDLESTVSGAAEMVGLRRPARRSRRFFAVGGLILAAAAGWGLLRSPQARARSQQILRSIRERVSSMRPNAWDLDVGDRADPVAFPAAETKPIPPDRWNESEDLATPDYPDGLGSDTGDTTPAREARKSRA